MIRMKELECSPNRGDSQNVNERDSNKELNEREMRL